MEEEDFKEFATGMIEYVANYMKTIRNRQVLPDVRPGYLKELVPATAPQKPDNWQDVMADIEKVIMPGITHWQSPQFHAYFLQGQSYPSIVADILSNAIACAGITWIASPACTELESLTMDWLGKMVDLPSAFLSSSGGKGGGVIQGTASESTLVALLAAKAKILKTLEGSGIEDIASKLVAYASYQAHSSVPRAGLLGGITMRLLQTDSKRRLRGETLMDAIKADRKAGLIPFYIVATLGTTTSCAFDNLDEIGDVAIQENLWLHVDAAYAGSAFVCPEYRYLMKGVEKADSFNFNPHKWMLVNFDCAAMWIKDPSWLVESYNVDPLYLKTGMTNVVPDYRHWQIPFGRRFRSLKLWFVLRLYGVEKIQAYIRKHIELAHYFEELCISDDRFEVVEEVVMGLVCFRIKGSNEVNQELLKKIYSRGKIFLVPSKIDETYFLRLAICSRIMEKNDVEFSWNEIVECANQVLNCIK